MRSQKNSSQSQNGENNLSQKQKKNIQIIIEELLKGISYNNILHIKSEEKDLLYKSFFQKKYSEIHINDLLPDIFTINSSPSFSLSQKYTSYKMQKTDICFLIGETFDRLQEFQCEEILKRTCCRWLLFIQEEKKSIQQKYDRVFSDYIRLLRKHDLILHKQALLHKEALPSQIKEIRFFIFRKYFNPIFQQ